MRLPSYNDRPGGYRAVCLDLLLALVLLAGCSRKEPLGQVSGQVTFQGKPVTQGQVVFGNAAKGVFIMAPLQPDGSFRVEMAKGFGLPLGDYTVAVVPPDPVVPMGQVLKPPTVDPFPFIPPKYRQPETSGLTISVKPGENPFTVDMQP